MQLVRDAERLTASEFAQLPLALARLYEKRSDKERQAMLAQPFFDALVKPWALEPSKLTVQVCHTSTGRFTGHYTQKFLSDVCAFKSAAQTL